MAQIKYLTCFAGIIAFCTLGGAIHAQERVHVAISIFPHPTFRCTSPRSAVFTPKKA
jgi:hypothetical protein